MIIMLFIGLNMLTMTLDHYQQEKAFSDVLDYLNMIFICIFTSESLMKMFALRYHYFTEPWNLFDVVVVVLSILSEYPFRKGKIGGVSMTIRDLHTFGRLAKHITSFSTIRLLTIFAFG